MVGQKQRRQRKKRANLGQGCSRSILESQVSQQRPSPAAQAGAGAGILIMCGTVDNFNAFPACVALSPPATARAASTSASHPRYWVPCGQSRLLRLPWHWWAEGSRPGSP